MCFRLRERSGSRLVTGLLTLVLSRMARRHGGYVGKTAVIEGFLSLPHGLHGVYISRYARIGSGCRIYQNVTIGEVEGKAPQIGRNCLIGAGAVVVGGIRIGDGVKIGAGAVVTKDIPPYALVVGNPSRQIGWVSEYGHRLSFNEKGIATCSESNQQYLLEGGIVTRIS